MQATTAQLSLQQMFEMPGLINSDVYLVSTLLQSRMHPSAAAGR